jgi:diguanylate cyclase (GGDEF)-like protein
VLLVEADRASAALTVAELQAVELRVRAVPDPKLVPGLVAELRPDLLLLDTGVRGLSAYDLCRALRLDSATQDLPIVFLANSIGPEDRLPAYLAGGDDLLQKPVIVEELQTRVRNLIDRARLRADRASLDPMTGLQLRGSFLRELASFGVAQRSTVVALLDLDGMTRLNERRGYAAGDRALTALGRQVRRSFMSDVLRGRWGDDEIALAFPGEDLETVGLVMRRVQRDFAQTTLLDRTGVGFQLSFSVGMAVSPADGENSEELLRAAERRLQAARAIAAGSLVSAG